MCGLRSDRVNGPKSGLSCRKRWRRILRGAFAVGADRHTKVGAVHRAARGRLRSIAPTSLTAIGHGGDYDRDRQERDARSPTALALSAFVLSRRVRAMATTQPGGTECGKNESDQAGA